MATDTATADASLPSAKPQTPLLAGFNRLNLLRQAGLLLGLSASIALGFAVVLWSQREPMQPLYPSMQGYNVNELIEVLDTNQQSFELDPSSGVVLVPADNVHNIRLQVAAAGISRDEGYGFEYLSEEPSLGTSQFLETTRYRRSLEGELQRTISSLRYVQTSRVHLATPERSVFLRDNRQATASVFLTLATGRRLTDVQVQAIANLIASSVPDMSPEAVTVVDQNGNLLSNRSQNNELGIASEQFAYVREFEETLTSRISRILHPLLGAGRFTAEVAADIDFTRTEQAEERFDPDNTVLRSEQSLSESRNSADVVVGIPGALSNQPPPAGVAPEQAVADDTNNAAPAANTRNQSTRNFEVDRTISYTNYDPVNIRRLSVAVVIDEPTGEGAQPWTVDDMDRITALVRDAVGFDASRGDSVTVINKQFAQIPVPEADALSFWQAPWFVPALKQLGAAGLVLLLVFGVLMPAMRRLSASSSTGKSLATTGGQTAGQDAGHSQSANVSAAQNGEGANVTLSGGDDLLLTGPGDNYEHQLGAIKGLVAQDPARVAQVVKNWINNDN